MYLAMPVDDLFGAASGVWRCTFDQPSTGSLRKSCPLRTIVWCRPSYIPLAHPLPVLLMTIDDVLGTEDVNSEVDVTRDTVALGDVGLAVAVLNSSLQAKTPWTTVIPSSAWCPVLAKSERHLSALRTHRVRVPWPVGLGFRCNLLLRVANWLDQDRYALRCSFLRNRHW